jgi:hypothetical protein
MGQKASLKEVKNGTYLFCTIYFLCKNYFGNRSIEITIKCSPISGHIGQYHISQIFVEK